MPPKKKAKLPSRAGSTPSRDLQATALATPGEPEASSQAKPTPMKIDLNDPWTDEQEISLFKSIIKYKPVGIHKHFRMLSISQQMKDDGQSTPQDKHTRIPGIWRKLESLYNLEALDEREDAFLEEGRDDGDDPWDEPFHSFHLPEREFGELMFARRLAPNGTASPPALQDPPFPHLKHSSIRAMGGRSSTADTEEESPSSPASNRPQQTRRGGRGIRRGARSRLRTDTRSNADRQRSHTASIIDEEEDTEQGEEERDVDDDEGEGRDESTTADSPAPRSSTRAGPKGARGGRGKNTRGGPRSRARRRGM
ncbi:MAG: hypothetical protein M1824_000029 [Vezdaea acicularis]|nr:MAG: hypothetical protein M1824_000029 [Vezdaea acicularis]